MLRSLTRAMILIKAAKKSRQDLRAFAAIGLRQPAGC